MGREYSTKWILYNGQWYSPYEWEVYTMVYREYAHVTDYCEIDEILQEGQAVIDRKLKGGKDVSVDIKRYFEFEGRVRKYLHEQIKRTEELKK